jgi:Xaa-Pro aminopeptidase
MKSPSDSWTSATLTRLRQGIIVDEQRMHRERLQRAREQLAAHGFAAALLFDPLNVRYTTTAGFAFVSSLHYTWRWALVPVDSPPILWDYEDCIPVAQERWPDGDIRPGDDWHFFLSGTNDRDAAAAFAREIRSVLIERGIERERIAIDRCEALAFFSLQEAGIRLGDAARPLELARAQKTQDEIEGMRYAARIADLAIDEVRHAIGPGRTENELFGVLNGAALKLGAEYNDARLMLSGRRTNPWMQESSDAVIEEGDLVAFDTDLVGPRGFLIDISRTYLCGNSPTAEQRRLHRVAFDFLQSVMPKLRLGASFPDLGERLAKLLPAEFHPLRYGMIAHGVGFQDEWPVIKYEGNYPGELQAGMVLSVEAYAGVVGGKQGVKLEEQILIKEDGFETFSHAPFDERLFG